MVTCVVNSKRVVNCVVKQVALASNPAVVLKTVSLSAGDYFE